MSKKDATLLAVETSVSGMTLLQLTPRRAHEVVSLELARKFAKGLSTQIGELYSREGTLTPSYPAYKFPNDCGYDAVTFGVQLHVLSREELKAIIDEETAELRKQHSAELSMARSAYDTKVKTEAKRLLEKASL